VKLEGVRSITVSGVPLEILWEVDNLNSFERTLFDTDTASCRCRKFLNMKY